MIHSAIDSSYLIGLIVMAVLLMAYVIAGIVAAMAAGTGWGIASWAGLTGVSLIFWLLAAWPPLPGQYNTTCR